MNCPSSCEFSKGHIRYSVKAVVVRSMAFDVDKKVDILVIQPLDLNFLQPPVNYPMQQETSKTFFCGLGSTMFFSVAVPKSGFAVGEILQIPVSIRNTSSVDVQAIKVSLKQNVKFVGRYQSLDDGSGSKMVNESYRPVVQRFSGVPSKETRTVQCAFPIPHLPSSNVISCSIIAITYELSVCAKVGAFHFSPTLHFPITIGTVPLGGAQIQQPNFYPAYQAPMTQPYNQFAIVPSAPFSNAPPSFEDVVVMRKMDN
jgi:hypothetical protein